MKDNYSWLDGCLNDYNGYDFCGEKNCNGQLKANELKQTIISQIEIEKLRARIETYNSILTTPEKKRRYIKEASEYVVERIADLTEKLKELER